MSENSAIEWTHHTFNPWWGCVRVSPGCNHCYAETLAKRFGTEWGMNADRRFFGDKHWNEPLRWDRAAAKAGERHRVFCASMADVFEDRGDLDQHRVRLWDLIEATPHLDWLLLTKRPENVLRMVPSGWVHDFAEVPGDQWPANVWVGTTVEDQQRADERTPHLRSVPAPVRFLSCEPLLGPVDLNLDGIGWVIVGGESGRGARPMHPEWARDLRNQCVDAGVPFLFKQWGEWLPESHAGTLGLATGHCFPSGYLEEQPECNGSRRVGKKAAGRVLDGRTWDQFPAPVEV